MNFKKSMSLITKILVMYFSIQKKNRIIKSFSLRAPAKSVRISKSLNYRGLNYTGVTMGVC